MGLQCPVESCSGAVSPPSSTGELEAFKINGAVLSMVSVLVGSKQQFPEHPLVSILCGAGPFSITSDFLLPSFTPWVSFTAWARRYQ